MKCRDSLEQKYEDERLLIFNTRKKSNTRLKHFARLSELVDFMILVYSSKLLDVVNIIVLRMYLF